MNILIHILLLSRFDGIQYKKRKSEMNQSKESRMQFKLNEYSRYGI